MYDMQLTGNAVSLVVVISWNKDNLGPVLGKGNSAFFNCRRKAWK